MDGDAAAAPAVENAADAPPVTTAAVARAVGFITRTLESADDAEPPPPDQAADDGGPLDAARAGMIDTNAVLEGRPAGADACKVTEPRPSPRLPPPTLPPRARASYSRASFEARRRSLVDLEWS